MDITLPYGRGREGGREREREIEEREKKSVCYSKGE